MSRAETLLRGLDKKSKVIEIGPSFAPLTPKRDGWNAFVVDHDTREGLIAKYRADPHVANVNLIEDVDHVWRGGSIADAIPAADHGTFDAFIASHVIEHTTDVVTFLEAAQRLLKPDGLVILAVPDKRKCFDLYRPVSTTGAAIAAYREKRALHRPEVYFDFVAYHASKAGAAGWRMNDTSPKPLTAPLDQLLAHWDKAANATSYVDAHQWVFTPSSLALMVLDLAGLGLLDLRVEATQEADNTEFHAWLRKGREQLSPQELQAKRLTLMEEVVIELAEQSRQIPRSPLATTNALSEPQFKAALERIGALEAELAPLRRLPKWFRRALASFHDHRRARRAARRQARQTA